MCTGGEEVVAVDRGIVGVHQEPWPVVHVEEHGVERSRRGVRDHLADVADAHMDSRAPHDISRVGHQATVHPVHDGGLQLDDVDAVDAPIVAATTNAAGVVTIQFQTLLDNASVAGIEVLSTAGTASREAVVARAWAGGAVAAAAPTVPLTKAQAKKLAQEEKRKAKLEAAERKRQEKAALKAQKAAAKAAKAVAAAAAKELKRLAKAEQSAS